MKLSKCNCPRLTYCITIERVATSIIFSITNGKYTYTVKWYTSIVVDKTPLNHYQTALIEILQSAIYSFLEKIMRNGPVHQYWLIL